MSESLPILLFVLILGQLTGNTEGHGTEKQFAVFLHCGFRTGSSLLGELFNNYSDSFYVFEPLFGASPEQYPQVLEDIVNTCSSKYWGLMERSSSFKDNDTVFSDCLSSRLLVLKTIRVRDVRQFTTLTLWRHQPRVIHLVRDPRGVLYSRLQYPRLHSGGRVFDKSVAGVKEAAAVYCGQGLRDAQFLESVPPEETLLVKFEDLATNTKEVADKIYIFLGQSTPAEVTEWLTRLKNRGTKSRNSSWRSTKQDSDKVLKKWRSGLSEEQICAIERTCEEFMEIFGYDWSCF